MKHREQFYFLTIFLAQKWIQAEKSSKIQGNNYRRYIETWWIPWTRNNNPRPVKQWSHMHEHTATRQNRAINRRYRKTRPVSHISCQLNSPHLIVLTRSSLSGKFSLVEIISFLIAESWPVQSSWTTEIFIYLFLNLFYLRPV